jgi:hypothetical protein
MGIFKLETEDEPIDENFIFFVNIFLIWIVLPLFGLLAIKNHQYNPGLIVSLLVNIPIGLWSILFLIKEDVLQNFFLNPHLAIGLGVNALLPITGVAVLRNYQTQ